jgi:hypothetical protein
MRQCRRESSIRPATLRAVKRGRRTFKDWVERFPTNASKRCDPNSAQGEGMQ